MDNLLSQEQFNKTSSDIWRRETGTLRAESIIDFHKLREAYADALTEIEQLREALEKIAVGDIEPHCSECGMIGIDEYQRAARTALPAPLTDKEKTS